MKYIITLNKNELITNTSNYCSLINNLQIDSYRLNISDLKEAEEIFPYIKKVYNVGLKKIILDIPFPRAKTRIYCQQKCEKIEKNRSYKIYYSSQNNCGLYFGNIISDCKYTFKVDEQLVVGDGEGIFVIKHVTKSFVEVIAMHDFIIISGKSVKGENTLFNYDQFIFSNTFVDYMEELNPIGVALSFISNANEIVDFRRRFGYKGKIYSKIEFNLENILIEEVIKCSDGIILGRGDFCLYNPIMILYSSEKYLANLCKTYNKEFIVATDVLRSLKNQSFPSRADIIDFIHLQSIQVDKVIFNAGQSIDRTIFIANKLSG